jgi:hypothetical protein
MSYRDEQDDGRRAPPVQAGEAYENDEDFVRGNDRPGKRRPRRSGFAGLMRLLLAILLVVVVLGGGLYAAVHFRVVDPAQFGLSGLLGNLPGGGQPTTPRGQADVIFDGDSARLSSAPGNTVQPDASAKIAWLRTTVKSASAAGAPADGVSIVIPKAVLPRFEGRRARVTISARSGADGHADPVRGGLLGRPEGQQQLDRVRAGEGVQRAQLQLRGADRRPGGRRRPPHRHLGRHRGTGRAARRALDHDPSGLRPVAGLGRAGSSRGEPVEGRAPRDAPELEAGREMVLDRANHIVGAHVGVDVPRIGEVVKEHE